MAHYEHAEPEEPDYPALFNEAAWSSADPEVTGPHHDDFAEAGIVPIEDHTPPETYDSAYMPARTPGHTDGPFSLRPFEARDAATGEPNGDIVLSMLSELVHTMYDEYIDEYPSSDGTPMRRSVMLSLGDSRGSLTALVYKDGSVILSIGEPNTEYAHYYAGGDNYIYKSTIDPFDLLHLPSTLEVSPETLYEIAREQTEHIAAQPDRPLARNIAKLVSRDEIGYVSRLVQEASPPQLSFIELHDITATQAADGLEPEIDEAQRAGATFTSWLTKHLKLRGVDPVQAVTQPIVREWDKTNHERRRTEIGFKVRHIPGRESITPPDMADVDLSRCDPYFLSWQRTRITTPELRSLSQGLLEDLKVTDQAEPAYLLLRTEAGIDGVFGYLSCSASLSLLDSAKKPIGGQTDRVLGSELNVGSIRAYVNGDDSGISPYTRS